MGGCASSRNQTTGVDSAFLAKPPLQRFSDVPPTLRYHRGPLPFDEVLAVTNGWAHGVAFLIAEVPGAQGHAPKQAIGR